MTIKKIASIGVAAGFLVASVASYAARNCILMKEDQKTKIGNPHGYVCTHEGAKFVIRLDKTAIEKDEAGKDKQAKYLGIRFIDLGLKKTTRYEVKLTNDQPHCEYVGDAKDYPSYRKVKCFIETASKG